MNYSDKLALIREYKKQGGNGSYLSVLQSYAEGGEINEPENPPKPTRKLQPWETVNKDGTINTNSRLLPDLPRKNQYNPQSTWMNNWVLNRGNQARNLAVDYKTEILNQPLLKQSPREFFDNFSSKETIVKKAQAEGTSKAMEALNNLNTVKYKDNSQVDPNSYITAAWGSYSPSGHSIYFTLRNPDVSTQVHEMGHATNLGDWNASRNLIDKVKRGDTTYNKVEKDLEGYYKDPDEIYSRVWELRKLLNLKPTDKVDSNMLLERKGKVPAKDYYDVEKNKLWQMFTPESISKLLNDLVSNKPLKVINQNDKLALIGEYKKQGGNGSYLSVLQSYAEGGVIEDPPSPYRDFTSEVSDPIKPYTIKPPTEEDYQKEVVRKALRDLRITEPPKTTGQKLKEVKDEFMSVIDVPQKALVYGLTSATRGGEGRYVTPNTVIREDWGNNNSAVNNLMDLTLDPLNLLTAPIRYGMKGEKITRPFIKQLLNTIKTTDNIDDVYNNESNPNNTPFIPNVQTTPVRALGGNLPQYDGKGESQLPIGVSNTPNQVNPWNTKPIILPNTPENTLQSNSQRFNNVVEKQKYWDSLVPKYGEGVDKKQEYLDYYDTSIPKIKATTEKYNFYDYLDDASSSKSRVKLPEELQTIITDFVRKSKAYHNSNSYLKGYYSKNELDTLSNVERDNTLASLSNQLVDNMGKFQSSKLNKFEVNQKPTTWRKILEARKDIKNKELLFASLMNEGGDKYMNDDFPTNISGYNYFGLDTFYDRVDDLSKKGYLPKKFKNRLAPYEQINEKGTNVMSANFQNLDDVVTAKNAVLEYNKDYIKDFARSKSIELSKEAENYFMLAAYNGGEQVAKKMLEEYNKAGILKGNSFLAKESFAKYRQLHKNIVGRLQSAEMLKNELNKSK